MWRSKFFLKCNYSPSKLPLHLSKFHEQALLSWKLIYVHNFSPHKSLLWNNQDITVKNKSIFFPTWHAHGVSFIIDLVDKQGNILSYENFMSCFNFPIRAHEFITVCKAIPSGILQLMKCHSSFLQKSCYNHSPLMAICSLIENVTTNLLEM